MSIIISHPTANTFSRALVNELQHRELLFKFHTTLSICDKKILNNIAGITLLSELRRRQFDVRLKPYLKNDPLLEIGRFVSQKLGLRKLIAHETGVFSVDAVYKHLDRKVANSLADASKKGVSAVYAYEDGALQSFSEAKRLGIKCIYDLPIAYWDFGRQLMLEEAERLPNWAVTLAGGIKDSTAKLNRKVKELALADAVVVPSKFVQDSLPTDICANKQIVLSPFGSPPVDSSEIGHLTEKDSKKPLRILFAGSMGQRKGLGDLFAAIKSLNTNTIELVVMGSLIEPLSFYRRELPNFTYEQGRAHNEVLALMRSCDVFCLPSIVEGRALVMQEAMSQGLPLIITPNTGGEDLVVEGETGFLVPIRRPDIIAEKLDWFLTNKHLIPAMAENAKIHAAKFTWDNYTNTIINSLSL